MTAALGATKTSEAREGCCVARFMTLRCRTTAHANDVTQLKKLRKRRSALTLFGEGVATLQPASQPVKSLASLSDPEAGSIQKPRHVAGPSASLV